MKTTFMISRDWYTIKFRKDHVKLWVKSKHFVSKVWLEVLKSTYSHFKQKPVRIWIKLCSHRFHSCDICHHCSIRVNDLKRTFLPVRAARKQHHCCFATVALNGCKSCVCVCVCLGVCECTRVRASMGCSLPAWALNLRKYHKSTGYLFA